MTPVDPMLGEHKHEQSADWPDIDFDCIPEARDKIKAYAAEQYGPAKVCSVGTWLTYKFRSAMQDVVRAYGGDTKEVIILTTNLPDDVDDLKDGGYAPCMGCKTRHKEIKCPNCGSEEVDGTTIAKLIDEYDNLKKYNDIYPAHVDMAVRMVGKIKALGTHAGGLIIANTELFGKVPMALNGGKWTSMWTEGRSPQLSKFGYIKWDVLGLKTLGYINTCRLMVAKTRGMIFDILPWHRQDKENNILGLYEDRDGNELQIRMDDPEVFKMINDLRTETVFQFETDVQRGILSNGVRDYYDLQVFNAMGHPGPMDSIPDYVTRRDDTAQNWRSEEHPLIADALVETHGIIVYQEDLQRLWQQFANFTAPEAEAARKAVAKKWKDKLKPVEEQWIIGSSKVLTPCAGKTSEEWARHYWAEMVDFGRYAFNKCLAEGTLVTDCITGESKPIEFAAGMTLHSSRGPDLVTSIHYNGEEPVYRVTFSNRVVELVTGGHRYATDAGFIKVIDISGFDNHSFKYISGGMTDVQEANRIAGVIDSSATTNGGKIHGHSEVGFISNNLGQFNNTDQAETQSEATICYASRQSGETRLSGQFKPGNVLLDWISDGGWLFVRQKAQCFAATSESGSGWGGKICGILRCQSPNSGSQGTGSIDVLKQEIGLQIERIWSSTGQKRNRDHPSTTISNGFSTGVYRWRWDDHYKWEGLSNNWIRFEFGVHNSCESLDAGSHSFVERQCNCSAEEYTEYTLVTMDWLQSMQVHCDMAPSAQLSNNGQEEISSRIHIVSIEAIGVHSVYSPEMLSSQHDYAIDVNHPIAANSHSCAYIMAAYLTAWFKIHFTPEWWASVMSDCHPDKRVKYMNVARSEGVKFGAINVEDISVNFAVDPTTLMITPGLTSIKGVGDSAVKDITLVSTYSDIDDFVLKNGKNKTVLQRLILLGAFQRYHSNIRATWMWYQYKYCTGQDITELKKEVRAHLLEGWTEDKIKAEVERQAAEFKIQYPKRKIPPKIVNWKPKAKDDRDRVMALYSEDYTLKERLDFEKEYLGYYWHSPMDLYHINPDSTIKAAKDGDSVVVCAVVEKVWMGKTKRESPFARVSISDGLNTATLILWENELALCQSYLREKVGIRIYVDYDSKRGTFTLQRRSYAPSIHRLDTIEEHKAKLNGGYEAVPDDEDRVLEGV